MKRKLSRIAMFATVISLITGCKDSSSPSASQSKPSFDVAAVKTTIEKTTKEFESFVRNGDAAGIASLYATDAKLMGPNMPEAAGRNAIQESFAGMIKTLGQISLSLHAQEISGNEEMVNEVGVFSMTDKAGKEIDKGKYIVLWKMEDGKWKLYRDCWNSDLPCPPSN